MTTSSKRWTTGCAVAALIATGMALPFAATHVAAAKTYGSAASLTNTNGKSQASDNASASKTLKAGLAAVKRGRTGEAMSALSRLSKTSLEYRVLSWTLAVSGKNLDAMWIAGVAAQLPHWPAQKTMRANIERALIKSTTGEALAVAFSATEPVTDEGRIALAKAHLAAGRTKSAFSIIAPVWRGSKLDAKTERTIEQRFGRILTRADYRARVEMLLSKRRLRGAERLAGKAGVTHMVAARIAVERKNRDAGKRIAAVPKSQQNNSMHLLTKAMYDTRRERITNASNALLAIDPKSLSAPVAKQVWTQQRIVISDLLEANKTHLAYRLAAHNTPKSARRQLDQAFKAGWIALRKRGDAKTAQSHFARLIKMAGTPLSKSRGHYWLGRSYAANGEKSNATVSYRRAAEHDTTYYGQLAARELGRKSINISKGNASGGDRKTFAKYELVKAIAKLESGGHASRARIIYRHLGRHIEDAGELALLAARAEKRGDYQLSLQVGKAAFLRGRGADRLAWPLGAISRQTKTSGAGLPLAYAIARQESTFQIDARSPANALGLMQLLPTTAKRTAQSIGIRYSRSKLTTDASYNARLGTAFLDQQMDRFGGSFVLTFAAYNAGPRRAAEWIERFGDPRGAKLYTVIDWVETIPYSETRNYVQRVMENYQVYKTRLKGGRLTISEDIRAGRRG
ncbi:lytic transglycosylase domain-containing protein [Ahrensia sp. R2A130]|uniref:lytic transglycosylase domain-containing protein n=1 Tax=Ahrensia sp. R2A130 TaxID=744979 RepID=UPI0006828258|nr:lytic transglycosylase domain-containing protein [Ahrensia sp. R2A130]